MAQDVSGFLRWSAVYDGAPQWLVFLDGLAGALPTVIPLHDPDTPHDVPQDVLTRRLEDTFAQDIPRVPAQLTLQLVEDGHAYRFRVTFPA